MSLTIAERNVRRSQQNNRRSLFLVFWPYSRVIPFACQNPLFQTFQYYPRVDLQHMAIPLRTALRPHEEPTISWEVFGRGILQCCAHRTNPSVCDVISPAANGSTSTCTSHGRLTVCYKQRKNAYSLKSEIHSFINYHVINVTIETHRRGW